MKLVAILCYAMFLCLLTKKSTVFATDCGVQIRLTRKAMEYGMYVCMPKILNKYKKKIGKLVHTKF